MAWNPLLFSERLEEGIDKITQFLDEKLSNFFSKSAPCSHNIYNYKEIGQL